LVGAVLYCTFFDFVFSWAGDWLSDSVGNPRVPRAPTWIGSMIVAGQKGWPVLAVSALCGVFHRSLEGLGGVLAATWFLGLMDQSAALVVGLIMVILNRSDESE